MKNTKLWTAWAVLYLSTACFGFLENPNGLLKAWMILLSVAFFVPGFLLLRTGDRKEIRRVRILSIASLSITVILLIFNMLSYQSVKAVGTVLYYLLIVLSTPMICMQYWLVSLFLWAVLMAITFRKKQ